MAGTTARVLQLLELLESSALRTLAELSGELDVDERTVRRYIEHLRDMDIPVESVRGRYGGYRLATGFRMPPLMLSEEEALAVVVGMLQAETVPGVSTTAVQTAASKVRRSLPVGTAQRLATLIRTTVRSPGDHGAVPDAEVLLTVADAAAHRRPLSVRYLSPRSGQTSRMLHPFELVEYERRWYLIALDLDAGEERTFRIDRIRTARTMPGSFAAPSRSNDDAARRLVEGFARAERPWRIVLRVRAEESAIRARLPESVAVIGPADAGWKRVEIHAERLDWLPAVIVSLDAPVVVDEPAELRRLLADAAARLSAAAVAP